MSKVAQPSIPIKRSDLMKVRAGVNTLLVAVKWKPIKELAVGGDPAAPQKVLWRASLLAEGGQEQTQSLLTIGKQLSGDEALNSEEVNHVLNVIRDGLALGWHVSNLYEKSSSLDVLKQQNSATAQRLSSAQHAEFNGKITVAAAIMLFVSASYIVHELSTYEEAEVSALNVDFGGLPEVVLRNTTGALQAMLFYFASYCNPQKGFIRTGPEMVKMALHYFNAILDDIGFRKASFTPHDTFFTDVTYQFEGSQFSVNGFERTKGGGSASVEFKEVLFENIVGNREAKHYARRLAMRLACYDLQKKKNPFLEFSSLPGVGMGFGKPGTGKSMQIGATATLLKQLCAKIGLPFLFMPVPGNIVSTFQGGSAERMEAWMRPLSQNKGAIIYAPIDDGENVLEERTRQGVSSGVREVIAAFLRNTEGASAINLGNWVIEIFTNLPEQLDKAVMSRIQYRFSIDGAVTDHDFIDQDYGWWKRYEKLDTSFIGMEAPENYIYGADQRKLVALSEVETSSGVTIKDARLKKIIERVDSKFSRKNHGYFGALYCEVKKEYPFFTSRDARNIQSAVDARILDFDMPEQWFDDVEVFFKKDYDSKVKMLRELVMANMKGLSFLEIRFNEAAKYLDTLAGIANVEFERDAERGLNQLKVNHEAARRYAEWEKRTSSNN